jgi:hypothetical protein
MAGLFDACSIERVDMHARCGQQVVTENSRVFRITKWRPAEMLHKYVVVSRPCLVLLVWNVVGMYLETGHSLLDFRYLSPP